MGWLAGAGWSGVSVIPGSLTIVSTAYLEGSDVTPGTAAGLTIADTGSVRSLIYKVTVAKETWTAAALTQDVTIATLPAKMRLSGILSDTTAAYAGLAGTIQLQAGKSAGGTEYLVAHDVKTATVTKGLADGDLGTGINRANAVQGGDLPSWTGTTNISIRLTSGTGNLGNGTTTNLSAGSTTFYLMTEFHP